MLKWKREPGHFGNSLGDLGVVAIAVTFAIAGLFLTFAHFTIPKPAARTPPQQSELPGEVSVFIDPKK